MGSPTQPPALSPAGIRLRDFLSAPVIATFPLQRIPPARMTQISGDQCGQQKHGNHNSPHPIVSPITNAVQAKVTRRQYQSSPPRHDYHLTAAGRELVPVMHALRAWGDKWAVSEPPLRAEHHDHPISPYVACTTCGEPVCADDLEFISTVPDWDITGPKRPAHQSEINDGLREKP